MKLLGFVKKMELLGFNPGTSSMEGLVGHYGDCGVAGEVKSVELCEVLEGLVGDCGVAKEFKSVVV